MTVGRDRHGQPSLPLGRIGRRPTGIDALRRVRAFGQAVPGRFLKAPIRRVVEDGRAQHRRHRLELREVDDLPPTGPLAVVQRRQDGGRGVEPGDVVGVGDAHADRRGAVVGSQVREA